MFMINSTKLKQKHTLSLDIGSLSAGHCGVGDLEDYQNKLIREMFF